ncbi:protein suppressor of hairy wing-like isoform X2 [Sebastes umbrosus]|uniref:protein suppressor of hairy wing-like isoform X2 n=1 Tax=Sebastes umbrosus TaxID=72105 RepID=UPI00189CFB50|nr:protein suppressor of hairy wing-like isoform X2 [Sebastes umbrosus]
MSHRAPRGSKRTYSEAKRNADKARSQTRVNLGLAFTRWRALKMKMGMKSDEELACCLLDRADFNSRMCSVVGCGSGRRSAQRFKLPEDPERRLEWVQFLFEVNGQRLKESSWTDITVCSEHFTQDCFEPLTWGQLKPDAVPSLCVKLEEDEPLESLQHVEPVETTDAARQCDDLNCPTSSKKSRKTLTRSQASPMSSGISMSNSSDASNAVRSGSDQMQQNIMDIDLNMEKAALLQMKGKHVVNESCLFQLFRRKCPSCGSKLQMEKVTHGVLIILNQQCLQCDYRNQWKSQISASVPTAEDQRLKEEAVVIKQEMPTDDNPCSTVFSEIVTFSDEESDPSDEGEEGDDDGSSSDGDWNPTEEVLLAEELANDSEEEPKEEDDSDTPGGLKINELCTECGSFFTVQKPHTCEYKIKPFSCNICGKRCVTETSLKNHSRIHDETYDHPCKYCHVTFKTRVDKLKHEQTHQDNKDPYRCPDCPETFATGKKRSIHLLANHRTTKEYKCGVCGIVFQDVHHLRRHSVVHTGLKPYKCSVCQRGFNQSNHLKSHMRLHTGERPYKCRHCDKSFNHNVSLKSHVQRYHSSSSGRERQTVDERASDTGDAEDSGNKKGTDSEFDNVEEEQDTEEEEEEEEEEVQKKKTVVQKSRKRITGRPRGRPKRSAADGSVLAGRKKGKRSKTAKSKAQKTGSSDEESEDEQSVSDVSFDSAEEKETVRKRTGRSRGRPKNDSDTDFDPEEGAKKKKYSSSSKSSEKRGRGRQTKRLVD